MVYPPCLGEISRYKNPLISIIIVNSHLQLQLQYKEILVHQLTKCSINVTTCGSSACTQTAGGEMAWLCIQRETAATVSFVISQNCWFSTLQYLHLPSSACVCVCFFCVIQRRIHVFIFSSANGLCKYVLYIYII